MVCGVIGAGIAGAGVVEAVTGGATTANGSVPLTSVMVISLAPAVGIPVKDADVPTNGESAATILASLEFLIFTIMPLDVVRL